MNWHERSKWLAVAAIALLLALPANALEVVSPVNGSVLSGPSVLVQYVTQSASCQATLNGAAIPLEGCRNFTVAALQGENVLSLWDGLESLEVRFTYGTGVARATVTPSGVIVRGRTAYTIPAAIVTPEGQAARETTDIRGLAGSHRLELRPIGNRIRNVVLDGVVLPQQVDIGLEELSLTIVIDAGVVADAFAIDPTRVAFSNGTLTKTAVGNRVWKCALWDFDNRSCGGDWEMVLSVSPGLPYSVVFNATDPAYVETFDDSEAADIGVAALDNTTIVIAFIDSGSNDASFEVWNTNGVLLVDETDVDITVDGDSRVAVEAINTTHFIIGVLDGPEDDFDFYIYDRNGNQITGQTQIDPATNLNTDITLCQLGDRFATPWADDSDNDANYEIWDNNGAIIAAENQVDIGIAPSSTNQNLVDCGALNSTHWGYSFFDDADNDITLAIVDNTGTITVTETDLDINVGETGQTASTGMRNDRVVVAFYDSTDDDITITIRGASGASLTTILANTDIDTNAGTNSRIATTEIENNGNSEFIVAWQDTSDNTIKASTYDNNGNQITTPYNITTTPSASNLLFDVVGYNSNLGIGLCNATFAIAYTNSSGNTLFETYWRNGTRWDGRCGEPPDITAMSLPDPVVLNAGTTKRVECNLTTVDPDGAAHLVSANATLYHQTSSLSQPDDPGSHYTNASCTTAASSGAQRNYTCSFSLWYFALNGTWYCDAAVQDVHKNIDFEVANTTIDPLYALNVTETFLDFGDLETGQASANLTENVTNVGNMPINVSVLGYGSTLGDAYAFACAAGNLSVDVLRFAPNSTAGYAAKEALSGVYVPLRIGIPRQVSVGDPPQNISYWQTRIPDNTSFVGQCNGTVVFQADAS